MMPLPRIQNMGSHDTNVSRESFWKENRKRNQKGDFVFVKLLAFGCWLAMLIVLTKEVSAVPAEAIASTMTAQSSGMNGKLNVVMVLIDDMGWGDLSCFGNREVETPHLDRLAKEGLRFESFYVNSPICSPSRTAYLTGQYPQRWRIHSYLSDRAENERRGMAHWLDVKAPSLAKTFKAAGYRTGHFGKWHMGGQRDVGEAPLITAYGFDETLTNFEGLGPRLLGLGDAHDGRPVKRHSLRSETLGNGPVVWLDRAKLTLSYAQAARAFMDDAVRRGMPFFVNVWPDDVHSPFFPEKAFRGDESKRALYLGVLRGMDAQLGVLLEHIRETPALRDHTLVVLCSDNGHEPGAGTAGKFRGSKATLYEGGIRSPLIVWGPGVLNEKVTGSVNRTSVFSMMDLSVSLRSLTGEKNQLEDADGENLLSTLIGQIKGSRQKPLFWRRPPDRKTVNRQAKEKLPDLAMRQGQWKLLCEYDGSLPQLYDMENDMEESVNLAQKQGELVEEMKKKLLEWHRQMPADRGAELAEAANQKNNQRPKKLKQ